MFFPARIEGLVLNSYLIFGDRQGLALRYRVLKWGMECVKESEPRKQHTQQKTNMRVCFTWLMWLIMCDDTTKVLIIILAGSALIRLGA